MKKLISILLFSICQCTYALEGRYCEGTKGERISALKELGKYSILYKKKHGYLPNPESEYNAEYEKGIPKALGIYMVSTNSEKNSVQYSCAIDKYTSIENSDLEICEFSFLSGAVNCYIFGFVPDK